MITVDTSVANLAGALGRPAWVILSHQPDWRWKLAGDGTPWYPTLRLFRRSRHGSWAAVIATIATELHRFTADFNNRPNGAADQQFAPKPISSSLPTRIIDW